MGVQVNVRSAFFFLFPNLYITQLIYCINKRKEKFVRAPYTSYHCGSGSIEKETQTKRQIASPPSIYTLKQKTLPVNSFKVTLLVLLHSLFAQRF